MAPPDPENPQEIAQPVITILLSGEKLQSVWSNLLKSPSAMFTDRLKLRMSHSFIVESFDLRQNNVVN
jgi:hypothetical protein